MRDIRRWMMVMDDEQSGFGSKNFHGIENEVEIENENENEMANAQHC